MGETFNYQNLLNLTPDKKRLFNPNYNDFDIFYGRSYVDGPYANTQPGIRLRKQDTIKNKSYLTNTQRKELIKSFKKANATKLFWDEYKKYKIEKIVEPHRQQVKKCYNDYKKADQYLGKNCEYCGIDPSDPKNPNKRKKVNLKAKQAELCYLSADTVRSCRNYVNNEYKKWFVPDTGNHEKSFDTAGIVKRECYKLYDKSSGSPKKEDTVAKHPWLKWSSVRKKGNFYGKRKSKKKSRKKKCKSKRKSRRKSKRKSRRKLKKKSRR